MRGFEPAQGGYTYVGLLLAVALLGVGLAAAGEAWHTSVQRDRERELLFIGGEFKRALESYYAASPGGTRQFPGSLQELLLDPRQPVTRRHLRRIYHDPLTASAQWGLILERDRIVGVHSLSAARPFRNGEVLVGEPGGKQRAPRYSDWEFVAGRP